MAITIDNSTDHITLSSDTPNTFFYVGAGGLLTQTAAPTNGQLLIGSTGSAPVIGNITAGTGISVTNGAGTINLSNTGVTSLVAGNGIGLSSSTGAITITDIATQINSVTAAGTSQSTGATLNPGYNIVTGGSGGITLPVPVYNGQIVNIENRSGASITIYPQSGAQIENLGTNTGFVLTNGISYNLVAYSSTQWYLSEAVPASGTGITVSPSATQTGVYTYNLNVPVSVANGGTGTTSTPTNGQLLIGNAGSYSLGTLTGGNGISVTNGAGSITISDVATQVNSAVAAAGTNQSTATVLSPGYNIVTSGSGGVSLPTPTYNGQIVNVENRVGTSIMIYPQSGGQIENFGTNTSFTTTTIGGSYNFVAASSTQWYLTVALQASGSGITITPSTTQVGVYTYNLTVPVAVTNGGTGSTTAFTQGSVVFAGSGGAYAQNNSNLFWNNTSNRLGVATNNPQSTMDISGNVSIGSYAGTNAATTNGLIVSGYIGAGTTNPVQAVDTGSTGQVRTAQILGSTSTPTIAYGAASGTGAATAAIVGNQMAFYLNYTTGTSTTTGNLFTVTVPVGAGAYGAPPILIPQSSAAAAIMTRIGITLNNNTSWAVNVFTTAPTASTTYAWYIVCPAAF